MNDFVIVGDLQMKRENLQVCEQVFDEVEKLAVKRNLNQVVLVGDLLDRRGLVEAACLNKLHELLSKSKLTFYILIGNHDLLSLYSTEHALEPLKSLPNVNIYDKPGQLGNILFMPYYKNPTKFLQDMNTWLPKLPKKPILICHQGVKEFTIGSGYTEEEAVTLSDLHAFKLVIAGHYHTPNDKGNVVFIGSPFSHSYGESNENKRLGILNTNTATIEFYPTEFRRHLTHEIWFHDDHDLLGLYFDPKHFNRCIVNGTQEQIKEFKSKNIFNTPNVKWIFRPEDSANVLIKETLSNKDKWIKWARETKKLDEYYINAGLDLLND